VSITTSLPEIALPTGPSMTSGPPEPEVLRRERAVLREILRLASERAAAEAEVEGRRARGDERAESEYARTTQALREKVAQLDREARAADEQRRRSIVEAGMRGEAEAKQEFATASRRLAQEFDRLRETARGDLGRARTQAAANFDTGQAKAAKEYSAAIRPVNELCELADSHRERLAQLVTDNAKVRLNAEPPAPADEDLSRFGDPLEELFQRLSRMEAPLKLIEGLFIPKLMQGQREAWISIVVVAAIVGIAVAAGGGAAGIGGAAAAGGAVAVLLRIWLLKLAKQQLERLYTPLKHALADADNLAAYCRGLVDAKMNEARRSLTFRRDEELKQAEIQNTKTIRAGEEQRDERIRKINEVYALRITEVQTTQQRELRDAIDAHDRLMADIRSQAEAKAIKLDDQYRALKEKVRTRHEASWEALAKSWREGMRAATEEFDAVERESAGYGPRWDDPMWGSRSLPREIPPVLRMGEVALDLASIAGGISADSRLMDGIRTRFAFPALRPFPNAANLLIEHPPEGRAEALNVLQASMLRMLTSLPPGMVKFTIVDPMGIGRGFGAFMHLADFDPAMVTNQVWTDPRQIEERLADLAAHMETVTQKYLRNEYATLEEYNAVAGEVAEPYRVLVIADFPAKIDEKAAARLAAIAAGGVPCGVLVLVAADSSRPMPNDFSLDEIRPYCERLTWDGSRLAWPDRDFGAHPLALDMPPGADFATREIQRVGAASKDARRVEVPFEFIAPTESEWWTRDSRTGLDVPLGKAGATRRQHLALGQGTSQHVLLAGRTGSGKSTLMHALITNIALNYSPDEVDLYLIDFKKGVEFKVYATHGLPHASVVAIESEREFGLSVLQRLDAELRLRAERFRDAGVQDINGYRNAPGTAPLPRILLVVDEFQEFFVEEDKLAQDAALWLDRLVRQGRAFGIHVLLGSQSLSGAFTLARSTLGQMAVRIALQCSETDAHLILAENNVAPKMLSRPGEAIYNDANGAPEGNHFFQVVWLSDERRESYLERIHGLAKSRRPVLARTPIVFEGDAAAELSRNPQVRENLQGEAWASSPRSVLAWLGDAVAIKDPTAALFRRLGGNHLLIVGQNDEAALGVSAALLIGLAIQFPPASDPTVRTGARFYLLDGTPEDHPHVGALERVAAALPHGVDLGGWRDTGRILGEIGEEVRRRQEEGGDGPEIFLFIHDLARFRDLRRREDEFSFSRREEEATPVDHLDNILREGAGVGVHVVTWCDTVNNLNRHFAHQALREFEMRVLFQMSPADSGQMLDSPAASKLGPHRALFYSEEQNRLEKFRPYGIPPDQWLERVGGRLRARSG
jgi:energy-coupling factor transporter ATP-binding protein EcfA2